MKSVSCILLACLVVITLGSCEEHKTGQTIVVQPDRRIDIDSLELAYDIDAFPRTSTLQDAIDSCREGDILMLQVGIYYAVPRHFDDSLCGNCLEHNTVVPASVGFTVKNKGITILGQGKDSTILVTGAGYGVYFENAWNSRLSNLKITGGKRDADGDATDASVVVRGSRVHIDNCALADNDHRLDSVVVGIGGVFGREGAEIYISECDIINNGWDGVALYRGAAAMITDCIIRKGRGAGIGVTWDSWCVAARNQISEFWKGIGAFGTSQVIAHNNLVYDNLAWGIIATGESYLNATNNVVHHNGNCGLAPWSQESAGRFVNNIVTENGWRKEKEICPCVGIWNYGNIENWKYLNNLVWNNVDGNVKDMPDIIGQNGNISADPMFVGDGDFRLKPGSPAIDAGYKEINDHDGSASDLGLYGGTSAWR